MVIDPKVKKDLLNWNDKEPIYSQFERKCAILSELSGTIIDPSAYQLQYDLHSLYMDSYVNLQTAVYGYIYEKHPELEFGMSGRLKSPFSHYEKIIRKSVELLEKDEFHAVEILDVYAMKIFIRSVSYDIDKISFDSDGPYIRSGANVYRLANNDVFSIPYNGSTIDAVVKIEDREYKNGRIKECSNVFFENGVPYIRITRDNEKLVLPLNDAVKYKKSNRDDLVGYCTEVDKDVEKFLSSDREYKFQIRKRKDYIANEKPSGYQSLQSSFYSAKKGLGIECQTRTTDMEIFNNLEREDGYKPNEHKITNNSLYKLPRYVVTSKFKNGYESYTMNKSECFEYLYKTTMDDYIKKMSRKVKSDAVKPNNSEPANQKEDVSK